MKIFLASLSFLLATANVSSALSVPVVVCSDDDGTIYVGAKEVQPRMFWSYLRKSPDSDPRAQTVLMLSCESGTRVNIINRGFVQDILDQLEGFADSPKTYTFQDVADIFNEDGIEAWVEEFDKNSCICGDDIEVRE
ncbi:MAG: hypothetical protein KAS85_02330 [Rhodobacteraceae bacterium]|nr:hypothetical protein [Paracoccaceae bacterium]